MAVWGADVDQLKMLGTKLTTGADAIEAQRNELNARLDSVPWTGPDAQKFRDEWSGTHMVSLAKVVEALKTAGTRATKNAEEQSTASA